MPDPNAFFPRNFRREYLIASRGEGCYIYTPDGRKILDAAGGAAVVSIGHGVREIGEAMARQSQDLAFAHTSQFHTEAAHRLASRIQQLTPPGMRDTARVFFTCGGSEATETAIKLAHQYWRACGKPGRYRIVSRRQSYHGATLGALSLSGNVLRREPFAPLLHEWGHIAPCFCYRCPLGLAYPDCRVACADELEKMFAAPDAESIGAFIAEPVVGATLGAVAPPDGYAQRIAEICRRNDILFIADEIMCGMGRTGKNFAIEHWGVTPDIILVGKGIASGYAPLGAVIVSDKICEAIARDSGAFLHGFTYNAHPVSVAAGLAVLDYIEKHKLFGRVAPTGRELLGALEALKKFSIVGDVRGLGLLCAVEFVADAGTRAPFADSLGIADRVYRAALERGVTTYPMQGVADGTRGDHLLLAPPFTISSAEIRELSAALSSAIAEVSASL